MESGLFLYAHTDPTAPLCQSVCVSKVGYVLNVYFKSEGLLYRLGEKKPMADPVGLHDFSVSHPKPDPFRGGVPPLVTSLKPRSSLELNP